MTKYRHKVLRGRGAGARPAQGDLRPAGGPDFCAGGRVAGPRRHAGDGPQLAPAKLVQFLNGPSSRLLQLDFQHLRSAVMGQHLSARGYFCRPRARSREDGASVHQEPENGIRTTKDSKSYR
jgi:hypothetical protein